MWPIVLLVFVSCFALVYLLGALLLGPRLTVADRLSYYTAQARGRRGPCGPGTSQPRVTRWHSGHQPRSRPARQAKNGATRKTSRRVPTIS